MYPLTLATPGNTVTVVRIGGNPETKRHLEDLGFVCGSVIEVITESAGNLVVNVKETRVAISKELAAKIMVH